MNRRRKSSALSRADVNAIIDVWHYARTIGLPLNMLVTVKPVAGDVMAAKHLCSLFNRIKNLHGSFARRHTFEPANLWTREIRSDGQGEHMHMLCNVPKPLEGRFQGLAVRWMEDAGECDVRSATYRQVIARDGCWHSIGLYIAKQMTPQAAFARPVRRMKGGVIEGKRWGCSRNLRAALTP
jgi:hypothetical protein